MGKNYSHIIIKISVIVIFLLLPGYVFSQGVSEGEQKVEDDAFTLFTNKEYDKAMPLFTQLLSLHPQDPSYNYGYGVCLIETNTDTKGALKYLNFAASKSSNPVIFYYIGRSYHLNYQFDKAISNYKEFKLQAPKPTLEEFDIDQKIRMAENGKELINYVSDLIVLDNKKIKDENFFYSYRLDDFGGKLIVTPKDFKTKVDEKKKYRGITFIWNDAVAFFSSYGDNKKGSLDLYQVQKNFDGTWSPPIILGQDVNTKYDENFPYLSPDGKTFYFSSKGFNSMGGYDIFKSNFDSTTYSFSKPENMDFPINSPFDDLLYVTDMKNTFAYFASNRETSNDQISVYRIQVDKNRHEKPIQNIEEVIERAKLNVTPLADRVNINAQQNDMVQTFPENKDTSSTTDTENLNLTEIKPTSKHIKSEVAQVLQADKTKISDNLKQDKSNKDFAVVKAYEKNEQAKQLKAKANQILKGIEQVPNADEQAFLKKEAQDMLNDATKLELEAILNYNLSKQYDQTIKYKEDDLSVIKNFVAVNEKNDNTDSVFTEYEKKREQIINNQSKYTTIAKEIDQRNTLLANNLKTIKGNESELNKLDNQIQELENNTGQNDEQLNKFYQQKNTLESKTNYLKAQNDGLQNEIKYLQSFDNNVKNSETAEIKQKLSNINEATLSKNISETQNDLELTMAENVSVNKTTETNNLTAQNNNTNNQTTNNQVSNNSNNQTVTQKNQNIQLADSLKTLISNKKEQINQTTDQTEKQNLQNEVNDLTQILKTIEPTTNNQVTQNENNTAKQTEETYKNRFPDMEIKPGDNSETKYEKTLFKQQHLTQLIDEQKNDLENLKTIRKSTNNPESAKQLDTKIESLTKDIDQNNKTLASTSKQLVALKQDVEKTQEVKESSDAELIYSASKYTPKNKLTVVDNADDQTQLNDLQKSTENAYYNYQQLSKVVDDYQRQFDQSQDKDIEKNLLSLKAQKDEAQKDYISNANRLNTLNYYYYDDKIYDSQTIGNDPQTKTANQLVNEAEYYFNLSKDIKESAKDIDDKKLQERELNRAITFQKVAIEKQKHALDIYTTQNTTASKNTQSKSTNKTVQLSADDLSTLKNANKTYYKSTVLEKEAESLNNEASELKKQAENTFNEKKKTDLNKKAQEKEQEAVDKQHLAIKNVIEADSLKFSVNAPYIDTLLAINSNKDTKMAELYVKEAYTYNSAAERLKIKTINEKNPDSILVYKSQIKDFSEKAVNNQQNAIDLLTHNNASEFVTVSPITHVNQLTTVSKNVETRNIPDVDEKLLYANMKFNPEDQKALDLANKIENKAKVKLAQVEAINKQIVDLDNIIETSDNEKKIDAAKAKKEKLINKKNFLTADAYDDYEPVNYTRYDILKSQLRLAKKGGDKTNRSKAIQLAVDAQKDFQKAFRLRDATFDVKDRKTVFSDLEKAYTLEMKAITQIEKSIALYKRLLPETGQPLLANNDTTINTDAFAIKNTGTVTHVVVNQEDTTTNQNDIAININNTVPDTTTETNNNENLTSDNTNNTSENNNITETDTTNNNLVADNTTNPDTSSFTNKNYNTENQNNNNSTENNVNTSENTNDNTTELDTSSSLNKNYIADNTNNNSNSDNNNSTTSDNTNNNETTPDTTSIINKNYTTEDISNNTTSGFNFNKRDIRFWYPASMKKGETYTLNVTIVNNNAPQDGTFARLKIELPKGLVATNFIAEDANSSFVDQTVKFIWMKIPSGKFTIDYDLTCNSSDVTTGTINSVFEYTANNNIKSLNFTDPIYLNQSAPLADNNTQNTNNYIVPDNTNNTSNQNTSTDNTYTETTNNNQTDNTNTNTQDNQSSSNNNSYTNKNTTNSSNNESSSTNNTTKTVSNNDVPYSYVNFDAYSANNPIPINPTLPSGIIFKVQVGAFSKPIPDNTFKGLNPLVAEKSATNRYYKYLLGLFQTFEAAQIGRTEVRNMGYRDAFIVAYKDGKRIPLYQARNQAKEELSGTYNDLAQEEINKIKNRAGATTSQTETTQTEETAPTYNAINEKQDLIYTVQIGVFKNTPKKSFFRGLSPVYQETTEYGFIRYFTGTFSSIDKATAEKNKIVRLGISDAFVTAYYNGKRITLNEAQNLLNQGTATNTTEEDINYPENPIPKATSATKYSKEDIWFTVQVGAFKNAVPLEKVQSLVQISRNNEIKQLKDKNDYTLFIVGNFKSYNKAKELTDILKNDGVTDAFVTAFSNNEKIDLKEAISIVNGQ